MVVFGGRSGEHEVSLASARAITRALENSGRYEVVPVGITREGRWISSGEPMRELESKSGYLPDGSDLDVSGPPAPISEKLPAGLGSVDVVFPVLHGPYGEDGTIQGMLELAGVPYVGSGVLGSAAGMDKPTMKKIFAHHCLPQVRWVDMTTKQWENDRETRMEKVTSSLGYPCFVKPARSKSPSWETRILKSPSLVRSLSRKTASTITRPSTSRAGWSFWPPPRSRRRPQRR